VGRVSFTRGGAPSVAAARSWFALGLWAGMGIWDPRSQHCMPAAWRCQFAEVAWHHGGAGVDVLGYVVVLDVAAVGPVDCMVQWWH
jgi:hypothetical protein